MSAIAAPRPGERVADLGAAKDASIRFIGRISTPWARPNDCPRQGSLDGPECRIELDPPWDQALLGIDDHQTIEVLYWMHLSRRDLLLQTPSWSEKPRGTFSLRSPVRPNPIAVSHALLLRRVGAALIVRGLDCVDGTPLLDLKPDRCPISPSNG